MKSFESERLIALPATLRDQERLIEISETWYDKEFIEGKAYEVDYIIKCINREDLPPIEDAKASNLLFYKIMSKENRKIIGYLNCYKSYPEKDTMWIGDFLIEHSYQQKGYGYEIINQFINETIILGFEKISLGVHMKNWTAINFWNKCGFNTISRIVGDESYGNTRFSIMVLEQNL